MDPVVVLELPSEDEIAVREERSIGEPSSHCIRKTLRYRNGMMVVMVQDFENRVYSIQVSCEPSTLFLSGNLVLKV